jgi:hypothetical protein
LVAIGCSILVEARNAKLIDWLDKITADCPKKQAHNMPHIVETDVPRGGFGKRLDAMYEFHTRRGVRAINSTGRHDENGRYYVRWRFADLALADTFATEFNAQEK